MDNRRKKPVITGTVSSGTRTGLTGRPVKQHISALYSPVNPFETDGRKENQSSTPVSSEKRPDTGIKSGSSSSLVSPSACKRLSSDFHRKCCGDENEKDHDSKSCVSSGRGRAAESPSPSADRMAGRRSQSVPRTALRPIATTLSTIKRMEYNLERARDAATASKFSSPFTMSGRRTPVSSVPAATPRTPTTPSVFSTVKTPVNSNAKIGKGIMSGSKPKTPPAPSTRSLALVSKAGSSSTLTDGHRLTPSDERKTVTESKQMTAVSYATSRTNSKCQSKDLVSSRALKEAEHVTVTQSGGKGNVNIKMRISMAIKKDAESGSTTEQTDGTDGHMRSLSPRTRAKPLLTYTPAVVMKEYPVEKTAVSVAVRLRPFSTRELKNPEVGRVVYLDKEKNCVNVNKHQFEFNHVLDSFDPDPIDDQEQVYEVVGKPLLDHCLEGYNACLFAYGQTGSGKTYSLTGEEDVLYYEKQGVIPRLIKDLFLEMQLDSIVTMTYIEIYNDQIFNLLNDATSDLQQLSYKIRESTVYGPYIPNLPPVVVESADDLLSRWSMGNIKRQKAATACNEHSSRSHAILQITVQQKYQDSCSDNNRDADSDSQVSDGDRLISKINLVDLAGSERVAQSHTTGDRFKEGTAINKSLLTLGKVISELSTMSEHRNKVHIPYRESALTFLLKESLGGNSRTIMLATISPANTQIEETLSTLRYASKAQRIVNCVRINEDPKILRIRQLEHEIQRLIGLLDQKGLTTKSLPSSPSTNDSSVLTSSPSTAAGNSSVESQALVSASPSPSDYTTPMKTPKATKEKQQQKTDKSDHSDKSEKAVTKADGKEKSEQAVEKKEKGKQSDKKKDGDKNVKESKSTAKETEVKQKTDVKQKDEKQKDVKQKDRKQKDTTEKNVSNQSLESVTSSSSPKESERKGQKKKSESEDSSPSPAKKEKKEKDSSSEKNAKKTKDSAVNTDSPPSASKKKKVDKLDIPPPVESKLLHAIEEIFSLPAKESGDTSQDTIDLTYVSAGDASSLLNKAIVDSNCSGTSDSTLQDSSRHVNFRDTVSVRSYQVSMDTTPAEVSAASPTTSDKKEKSPKKKKDKKSESPKPATKETKSDKQETKSTASESSGWGASSEPADSGWGASSEPATSSWGGESESGGGWGSSDPKDDSQKDESKEETATESNDAQSTDWGASSAPSDGWGSSSAPTDGWGASSEPADDKQASSSEPADDGWGASSEPADSWGGGTTDEANSSLNWENLKVDDDSKVETMSWSTCLKDNGVGDDAGAAADDWN